MKCIRYIKDTKETQKGTIVRVSDVAAEIMVKTGIGQYCPKSEYKKLHPKEGK